MSHYFKPKVNSECAICGKPAHEHNIRPTDLLEALQDLVYRCDGDEGMRADGSNIDTRAAHVLLERIGAHDRPMFDYCGGCGHFHPIDWSGDCRDDLHRFNANELDDTYGENGWDVTPGTEPI